MHDHHPHFCLRIDLSKVLFSPAPPVVVSVFTFVQSWIVNGFVSRWCFCESHWFPLMVSAIIDVSQDEIWIAHKMMQANIYFRERTWISTTSRANWRFCRELWETGKQREEWETTTFSKATSAERLQFEAFRPANSFEEFKVWTHKTVGPRFYGKRFKTNRLEIPCKQQTKTVLAVLFMEAKVALLKYSWGFNVCFNKRNITETHSPFLNCIYFCTFCDKKHPVRWRKLLISLCDEMILSRIMGVTGISIISFLGFISIKAFSDFAVIH